MIPSTAARKGLPGTHHRSPEADAAELAELAHPSGMRRARLVRHSSRAAALTGSMAATRGDRHDPALSRLTKASAELRHRAGTEETPQAPGLQTLGPSPASHLSRACFLNGQLQRESSMVRSCTYVPCAGRPTHLADGVAAQRKACSRHARAVT